MLISGDKSHILLPPLNGSKLSEALFPLEQAYRSDVPNFNFVFLPPKLLAHLGICSWLRFSGPRSCFKSTFLVIRTASSLEPFLVVSACITFHLLDFIGHQYIAFSPFFFLYPLLFSFPLLSHLSSTIFSTSAFILVPTR